MILIKRNKNIRKIIYYKKMRNSYTHINNNEKSSKLGYNYEYSLAISKCNERLEKLRNRERYLLDLKSKLNYMPDYRNFIIPLRKPVNPNPMLYAYQFIPPKYEPMQKPIITKPVLTPEFQDGIKIPQNYCNVEDRLLTLFQGINRIKKQYP